MKKRNIKDSSLSSWQDGATLPENGKMAGGMVRGVETSSMVLCVELSSSLGSSCSFTPHLLQLVFLPPRRATLLG